MTPLAVPLLVVAAVAFPQTRSFWRASDVTSLQPSQISVQAQLVAQGEHIAVYREDGYHFYTTGGDDEAKAIAGAIDSFDRKAFPTLVGLFGPCPDIDGNGKIILLIGPSPTGTYGFWPFDQLPENEAVRYGFHSNIGEVIYESFMEQGNRANWNMQRVTTSFYRLLHNSRQANNIGWGNLLARFAPFYSDLVGPRVLWGDFDLQGRNLNPSDSWGERGWSLLFLQYFRDRFGDQALRDLALDQNRDLSSLTQIAGKRGITISPADLLADFTVACWVNDASLGAGRFAFSSVVPPRPKPAIHTMASRPSSGSLQIGTGGMAFFYLQGTGERPLPFTLQGDPLARWVGRAIITPRHGPDRALPVVFNESGRGQIELPQLAEEDVVVIAVLALPDDPPGISKRRVELLWGLGWVPSRHANGDIDKLAELTRVALPDGGNAARTRIMSTLDRLGGLDKGNSEKITTRYAWAPESKAVVDALQDEAGKRNLKAQVIPFNKETKFGVTQQWQNVVIELPGSDPRRWPVVLTAHWDANRIDLMDSYHQALSLNDNAAGVAVALEAASAMSRIPHRAPIIVAFTAGGCHGAAGGNALLDHLQRHITAWVELEGVGIPRTYPRGLSLQIEGQGRYPILPRPFAAAFDRLGLVPSTQAEFTSDHAAAKEVFACGIPAFLLRVSDNVQLAGATDIPLAMEAQAISPDLLVLLTKALSESVTKLAGVP